MSSAVAGDFASEAMVRTLREGMRALGMQPPPLPTSPASATVPLDLKRSVVQSAVAQGGLACLPLLGRGLHALAPEPTHLALTVGQEAPSLFQRWQRLERYIHSRHRTRLLEVGEGWALLRHVHRDGGPPPLPAEDLVVCGVLAALLEANGLSQVAAEAGGFVLFPTPDASRVLELVSSGATATWRFTWGPAVQKKTQPGAASGQEKAKPDLMPAQWSALARAVAKEMLRQLPEAVPLGELAALLGMAPRSLQRALAAEGLNITGLAGELRFRLAGWHLTHAQLSMAETGFICGYADQAHLTREFQRRMGLTPAKYRSLFAA